ncbi:MAG: hypothetical protein CYPHOPRED_001764 [Cyphobasidiales sp. Tagirdzhanova-0007]|nr:MAG: hypothetical protein CYPHOPRED_001764 [Cyphobasidiales sp. Tagirdzhanova-0007]
MGQFRHRLEWMSPTDFTSIRSSVNHTHPYMDVLLVSAARTLLVRDGGGGDNGGGKDPSKTYSDTKGKSTHTSTLHAADHKAQSWIAQHVDLVIAACVAGVTLVVFGLALVWWMLRRRHKKRLADFVAAAPSDASSDFESKAGTDIGTSYGAQTANYPHFGAGQPPPPAPMQVHFENARQDAQPFSQPKPSGGIGEAGGYPLGPISEHTEEAEYMHGDDQQYHNDQQYDEYTQHDEYHVQQQQHPQPNSLPPPPTQGEYYPHHVQTQLSDPRNAYHQNERSNGRHLEVGGGADDSASMYSAHDRTKYV